MTELMQRVVEKLSSLPRPAQEEFAKRMLEELEGDEFDRKIAETSHRLEGLAQEALAERRAGRTRPIAEPNP